MRSINMLRPLVVLLLIGVCSFTSAQTRYWIGGVGAWHDASNWSDTPGGTGGAGIPRVGENVVISANETVHIHIADVAWCKDLIVDGSRADVVIAGTAEINISGSWSMNGAVQWQHTGDVRAIVHREGVHLDLKGITINGDLIFDGGGSWSMSSDLVLGANSDLVLRQGTLLNNTNLLKANTITFDGRANKRLIGGGGLIMLNERPAQSRLNALVDPGNSILVLNGSVASWDIPFRSGEGLARDINVCGTGPGQTAFVVNAQLVSDYNGFGVQCRGLCNGTVTVTVNGGSGNFSYQWLNNGPPSATWTTACGGPQIVIVTDLTQGISCPASVNVSEPAPLGVIFFGQGTPPTCADVCDGSRTALAVGGVPPHTYNWNNGAGTNSSFFELCAGLNTLQITDLNNCTFDTTFFFNIQPIQPNLTFTGTSCFGECDGTAEVAPAGGTGGLTVTWSPPPPAGQNTNSVSGLCAGLWSVTIMDSNGCDTTVTFEIEQPPPIIPSVTSTDVSCFGVCDGTASISPGGAPGPFTYVWSPEPGTGQSTTDVTGLCEGLYTVLITDQSSGCDSLVSVTIEAPPPFDLQAQVNDATCSNSCDGSIILDPIGGTPSYTYIWDPLPPVGAGTASISGLCPGPWSVTLTDASGCDSTVTFQISAPPALEPQLSITDITCFGECDGSASVSVTGGVPIYTYLWTPAPPIGQGTPDASGLCAGLYDLLITDENGCDTTLSFEIIEPPTLTADPSQTDISCGGVCDGTASLTVAGGVPGYTYLWSPEPPIGQGSAQAEGLCAGNWTVLITDANGCTLLVEFEIEDATLLQPVLQTTDATCPGVCDGTASVIVSGGSPSYTYAWSPEPGTGQGTANVTGLCPQDHILTITDALGCDTTITFTISAPDPIIVDAIVTDPTCASACDGSIQLNTSGGSGMFTYTWTPPPPIGQGTVNISGLCAGIWEVLIVSGGCDTTITFILDAPSPIIASMTIADVSCPGECDGGAEVEVSGGTPTFTFLWTPAPAIGQGTSVASGFCAGLQTLLITDDAGCDTTLTFTIIEPDPITATLLIDQASCNACDGTATIDVVGGTAGYTYDWGPGVINGQGTNTATDLCPGQYEVIVTDAAGCIETFVVLMDTPSGITANATVNDATCANSCDGSIIVVSSGGEDPHTYNWTPEPGLGQGTANASELCAGIWLLQITDNAGCDTLLQFTISSPDPIIPNELWTNESCNGPCDGTAQVSPSGGAGGFSYVWTPMPPLGQGTSLAEELCPGIWSVTITDLAGCDTTVTFDILDQQNIEVELTVIDALCADDCNGSASATVTGGVEPYTYVWSPEPGDGQGTSEATDLCAGIWQLTVTDDVGCDTVITFAITSPLDFAVDLVIVNEDCTGPCTGNAAISVTGGTGMHTYFWLPEPIDGQGTTNVTGLCSGTNYSVLITDVNGCDTTLVFTIDPFQEIIPNITSTPATCADACDGTASVAPVGGTPILQYVWIPEPVTGQGTAMATGFCAGTVEVLITDGAGCSITASIEVTAPEPLQDNAIVSDALCSNTCDGSIVVDPSGGIGPYFVYWSPVPQEGQLSLIATGLCMGNYLVQIIDSNGCDVIFSHDISKPDDLQIQFTTTPNECQQCIGTAEAEVTGGTPGYTYEWLDQQGNSLGTDSLVTDLCAGIYLLNVIDANGCPISGAVPVIDPDGEVLTPVHGASTCPTSCDGTVAIDFVCSDPPCVIAWSDGLGIDLGESGQSVDSLCAGIYFASVTNNTGCVSIMQVNVVAPEPITADISTTDVSCAGACDGTASLMISNGVPNYTINWTPEPGSGQGTTDVTGLCAGEYEVEIIDANGCVVLFTVWITAPDTLGLSATVIDISCNGVCDGSITPDVTGGVGSYTYTWTPSVPVGPDGEITSLCAGIYDLLVTDTNGCTIGQSYEIIEPESIEILATSTASSCPDCDGTASLVITGGTGSFEFEWIFQGNVVGTTQTITGLCGGLYSVTVTDESGCTASTLIIVPDNNAEVLTPIDGQIGCSGDCDGVVGVNFNCSVEPCTTIWTDTQGVVIAQDVLQVTDLCEGVYLVQVTNGAGCTSVATAAVEPSVQITPNLTTTSVTCPGDCDGTASVVPTGGIPDYAYVWTPAPDQGQGTPTAVGFCAGDHEVLISDASGCDTLVTFQITEPELITFAATLDPPTCAGDCDGAIDVIVSGGVLDYQYSWSPEPGSGQGSPIAGDLCAGTWTLTVTDANGCTHTESWDLEDPEPLVLAGSSTPSECGLCVGGVNVSASGGEGNYTYEWTMGGAIQGTDAQLNGICAGLYTVVVTDGNGCEASLLIPITDIDGEILTAEGGVTTCAGNCDGTVSVAFTCGDPDCMVEWFNIFGDPLGQDVISLEGLCAGDYLVMVTNASGCISIETVVVTDPTPIDAGLSTTDVTCFGDCNGTAMVSPTGGTGVYEFLWDAGDTTPDVSDLCAGDHQVVITDDAGCSVTVPVLINEPAQLTTNITVTEISCDGACDGSILIEPSGGTGAHEIIWSPVPPGGQNIAEAFDLCAGTYLVTVQDDNGCADSNEIILLEPDPIDVELAISNIACSGDCIGTATATITGGTGNNTITWSDAGGVIAQAVNAVTDLCAGEYSIEVSDGPGCTVELQFTIEVPLPITADLTFTNESCDGPCDGTAMITPSGGTGGFDIIWQPDPGLGQGTTSVTELCADLYTVSLTDQAGCDTSFTFTVEPYEPISAFAQISDPLCAGDCDGSIILTTTGGSGTLSYQWSPEPGGGQGTDAATSLCAGEYTVVISDPTGCDTTLVFTITAPPPITIDIDSITPASCETLLDGAIGITITGGTGAHQIQWSGPDNYSSSDEDISGLAPGIYTITVTDDNGCVLVIDVEVEGLEPISADAGSDQETCADGTALLDASQSTGGSSLEWTDEDGNVIGDTEQVLVGPLGPGVHVYHLTVSDGLCFDTDETVVVVGDGQFADAGPPQTIFANATATLGGSPTGPPGSTYLWWPDSLLSNSAIADPIASPTITTWFYVEVTAPNGCQSIDSVLVTILPDVSIPSGFTPNGDGWNDTWVIDLIELFPECEVEIYSRWGELLFQSVGYFDPWDGRFNGKPVPVGTYYYVIELNSEEFPEPYTGPLTVIR